MSQEVGSPASFGGDLPTEGDDLEAEVRESLRESPVTNPDDLTADSDGRTQADAGRASDDDARDPATRNDDSGASGASEDGEDMTMRFPSEFLDGLLGGDRGKSICKGGGDCAGARARDGYLSASRPWRGAQRDGDKQRLADYVARNGEAKPLSRIVRDVFGKDSVSGDDADYQLARRFFDRYPDLFYVLRTDDMTHVEPKVGLLRQRNVNRKNARRDGDDGVTGETGEKTGDDRRYPKELVRSQLGITSDSATTQLREDEDKRRIFRAFASWRESIDGTFSRFDSYRGRAPAGHLLVETESRFNSVAEAKSYDRLTESLDLAAESHDDGLLLTPTGQPVRFDSHADMAESLRDGVDNLKEWLKYRVGFTPDSIRVLEYQRNGQPHYHIALFGVRVVSEGQSETGEPTLSEAEVREYWDETRDLGTQVDLRPIRKRNDVWILHDDDNGRVSLPYYLGKASRRIREVAGTDAGDLMERFDAGELDWRVALYWAYGRQAQVVTRSPSLRESDDGDGDLEPIKKWEYVGTARLEDMPQSVVSRAIIRTASGGAIPPPATATAAESRSGTAEATVD